MTLTLREMTGAEYRDWSARSIDVYAQSLLAAGRADAEHALTMARTSYESLLPQGVQTPRHELFRAWDATVPVGWLWLGIEDQPNRPGLCYVYDVEVDQELRGRGYGRALMQLAEVTAQQAGCKEIGLNVFGFNTTARTLYESLGYSTMSIQMAKPL